MKIYLGAIYNREKTDVFYDNRDGKLYCVIDYGQIGYTKTYYSMELPYCDNFKYVPYFRHKHLIEHTVVLKDICDILTIIDKIIFSKI